MATWLSKVGKESAFQGEPFDADARAAGAPPTRETDSVIAACLSVAWRRLVDWDPFRLLAAFVTAGSSIRRCEQDSSPAPAWSGFLDRRPKPGFNPVTTWERGSDAPWREKWSTNRLLKTGLSTGAAFCGPGRRWLRPGRRCYTERMPKRSPDPVERRR